jgi:arylsulfatase A-like enzyme
MIDNLDQNLGRLMRALDRYKLSDNTVIIFFSDNGGELEATNNYPLRAGKGSLYEGGIRVPLIIRWPGRIKGNTVCEVPVIGTDLYPTIIQLAGEKFHASDNIDGSSLLPLFNSEQPLERDTLFWYYPHYSPQEKQPGAAIRSGKFKLIEHYDPPGIELYDLEEDLSEQKNLADKMPHIVSSMQTNLHNWLKSLDAKMFTINQKYKK